MKAGRGRKTREENVEVDMAELLYFLEWILISCLGD